MRVERSLGERRSGAVIVGPPESSAGVRTVNMPVSALRVLEASRSALGAIEDVIPAFGRVELARVSAADVRSWRCIGPGSRVADRFAGLPTPAHTRQGCAGPRRGRSSPLS